MQKNILQTKKKFRKKGLHFTADFYWQIVFSFGLVLVAGGLVLGFMLFMQMNSEFDISPDDVSNGQPISKKKIDKGIEYFNLRQMKTDEILNSTSKVIDPAL